MRASGGFQTCGTDDEGQLVCWGGSPPEGVPVPGAWASPPSRVDGLATAGLLALGPEHGCARGMDGRLHCWGRGDRGQLGDGRSVSSDAAVAIGGEIPSRNIDAVCVGGAGQVREREDGTLAAGTAPGFACAAVIGQVWCWGANDRGQLGDGTTTDRAVPTRVAGIEGAFSIACGGGHACAVTFDGALWCWGANDHGQLGIPSSELGGSLVPLEVDVVPESDARDE